MAQKTYFILPSIYEFYQDFNGVDLPLDSPAFKGRLTWKLTAYKIGGVEQLQNFPVSLGNKVLSEGEIADCSVGMTSCVAGDGSYNPFFNFLGFDFPLVDGFRRGISNGYTGTDFGFDSLNLTIDKSIIRDEFGVVRTGSFAIDIDYDQDFELSIIINAGTITATEFPYGDGVLFVIKHNAVDCSSTFTSESFGGNIVDISSFGFLNGTSLEPNVIDFKITPSCFDLIPVDVCKGCKTKGTATLVREPINIDIQAIKEDCCFNLPVFAEQGAIQTNYFNDFKSLLYKRQSPNDTFTFKLIYCGGEVILNDNTLGIFNDFGSFEDYTDYIGYNLSWNKVLNSGGLGIGTYQIKVEYDIAGTTGEFTSCFYDLKIYDPFKADKTVRLESVMNGYVEQMDINFSGLNWRDCVRVPATFGRMSIETEVDNVIYNNREKRHVKITDNREYLFESELLESCISSHLIDYVFKADKILVSDFDLKNHIQTYKDFECSAVEETELIYFANNRKARINATFTNLKDNRRKLSW